VDPQELRNRAVGTGPFRLKELRPDERIVLERNPDYFVKGRPYLDGIVYTVIRARPARMAALQAGQVHVSFPNDGTVAARDQLKSAVPAMVIHEVAAGVQENVLLNLKKPPFDNPKMALAVNLALDRPALIRSVHQGSGVVGGANLPPPFGPWGLTPDDLASLPGYGDAAKNKELARRLLGEAGYGPGKPLKVSVGTRAVENYVDMAVWVIDQLRQVGIDGVLEQFETGVWHPKVTRREYQIGTNLTGVAVDDPDGNFFENYSCDSSRNYTGYCNREVEELMVRQSGELDKDKRLRMVREIDRRLQRESARPILLHRMDYFMHWPQVKNLVPHHNIYSYGRMQEVWLDK
jgi:peptide/nickel transport system substrate-binding protein